MRKIYSDDPDAKRRRRREASAAWRAKHPDYNREWMRNHNRKNSEALNARRRAAYLHRKATRPEELRAQRLRWRKPRTINNMVKKWAEALVRGSKRDSSRRRPGREFSITAEHVEALWRSQSGLCFWTNVPMTKVHGSVLKVSIDRFDNSRGYEVGNVNLCTWFANRARNNMSPDDFRMTLAMVVDGLSRREEADYAFDSIAS